MIQLSDGLREACIKRYEENRGRRKLRSIDSEQVAVEELCEVQPPIPIEVVEIPPLVEKVWVPKPRAIEVVPIKYPVSFFEATGEKKPEAAQQYIQLEKICSRETEVGLGLTEIKQLFDQYNREHYRTPEMEVLFLREQIRRIKQGLPMLEESTKYSKS